MSVSWIYLVNAAILSYLIYRMFAGKVAWGVPMLWFVTWLGISVVANAFMFCSRAVPDYTIGLSFWLAARCAATLVVLVNFYFAHSFKGGDDFASIFWTLPALFNVALFLQYGSTMSVYEDGIWRSTFDSWVSILPVLIMTFYSVAALLYLTWLYRDLREGGNPLVRRGVAYLIMAFTIIFVTNVASPMVRDYLNPSIPLGEIGVTVGAVIIAYNLSWVKARMEKKQSFI